MRELDVHVTRRPDELTAGPADDDEREAHAAGLVGQRRVDVLLHVRHGPQRLGLVLPELGLEADARERRRVGGLERLERDD